jgi:opacity protein-like surface antigen
MKKLILGAALAVLAASPVLAQPMHHTSYGRLDGIRAQAPAVTNGSVFVDGNYAGTDPDANVRLQLQKNYPSVIDR